MRTAEAVSLSRAAEGLLGHVDENVEAPADAAEALTEVRRLMKTAPLEFSVPLAVEAAARGAPRGRAPRLNVAS